MLSNVNDMNNSARAKQDIVAAVLMKMALIKPSTRPLLAGATAPHDTGRSSSAERLGVCLRTAGPEHQPGTQHRGT
ncbi:hypothetical protein AAFF_G00078830 [Aldrovandia affinis]|uniref:Uncharacterized protein n=1 Tax=Aldrovandia affinis TaxID=143900 RepID=A0AAD7RXK3_9TELE|nr:hypothetical protein AAFF_G00078830 [Aldrovandia affinis]